MGDSSLWATALDLPRVPGESKESRWLKKHQFMVSENPRTKISFRIQEALAQQRTRMAIPLAHFEGSAWRLASHADSLATIGTLWVTKGMFPVESLPAAETDDVLGVTRHALRLLIPNDVTSFSPNRHSVVWSNLANDGSAVETQPAGTEDNSCPQAIGIVKGKTKTR
ncbi:hypothetical protein Bbelb_320920 [Branchiostoma belcheri]|nr:hypothetical protein Bbelb_320920 [Branchiostoma belcheri]